MSDGRYQNMFYKGIQSLIRIAGDHSLYRPHLPDMVNIVSRTLVEERGRHVSASDPKPNAATVNGR